MSRRLGFQVFIVSVLAAAGNAGCGDTTCGEGTVERDGVCVAADDFLTCGVGFKAVADRCEPDPDWVKTRCGANTKFDPATGTCLGVGGSVTCDKQCPAASGNTICLSGRIFLAGEYVQNMDKPTPLKPSDGVEIKIMDPIAMYGDPNAKELGKAVPYNDAGCFLVENIEIPFSGFLAMLVDDATAGQDNYVRTAIGVQPTSGRNSENLEAAAFAKSQATAWGNDLESQGALILWYRDATGAGVAGVTPTKEQAPPPWSGNDAFFFDEDITAAPYFDTAATATTKSGMVGVRAAALASWGGTKTGCDVEAGTAGTIKGVFFLRILDVEGC